MLDDAMRGGQQSVQHDCQWMQPERAAGSGCNLDSLLAAHATWTRCWQHMQPGLAAGSTCNLDSLLAAHATRARCWQLRAHPGSISHAKQPPVHLLTRESGGCKAQSK
ncbi:hypothetical protein [Corynebacterium sp. HS2168-gen11]|uniref:hypothetical protein n=1 Tax=Corynebacterium sp. HS2168-gen11 TaxID=2974027 RepID=UPI00216ABDCA|nr:hypothetical protein [Corynebacterium sp. HS2168-gen11]MCS4535270.1 hypothetical protein [Corynebacterium sp. HS2168-gen11]